MKTITAANNTFRLLGLLAGAILVAAPGLAAATAPETFQYTNRGEKTTVNVTNNNDGAIFNITAATWIPWVVNGSIVGFNGTTWVMGGFTSYNDGGNGINCTQFFTNQTLPTFAYFIGNSTFDLMRQALASTYTFTGTGNGTTIFLHGGIVPDAFNINVPGGYANVTIIAGLGSSTYNILLGVNSTVTVTSSNSSSAFNIYNIVF